IAREPLDPATGAGMGPGTAFGAALLADGGSIGLIPTAVGGTPLSRWVKGGDLYENAVRRTRDALKTGGRLAGVVWHQGESDCLNQNDADTYAVRLTWMLTDLRADLGRPELPVVIGQLGDFLQLPYRDTVRSVLRDMPDRLEHVAFVDSAGLPHKGDRLHFTGAAEQELGRRYAKAMAALLRSYPATCHSSE
ncbi:MAG TPA: sialate O-acetylesterase, partial [Rariglobus sp.]